MECDFQASGYRLPTEAEWEYACRARSESRFVFGDKADKLRAYSWYGANSARQTHKVGSKKSNPWGLHDMYGNVAEWCLDIYIGPKPAPEGSDTNAVSAAAGELRVVRGGSWKSKDGDCDSVARVGLRTGMADACFADDTVGFRCVRRAPTPATAPPE